MRVSLRHLQFILAASRHGSLRRAAKVLQIRQSTISRAIRELEKHLAVVLLVRSSGGVRPTSAGLEFLETAGRLLDDFDALISRAGALSRGAKGRLTLGLPTSKAAVRLQVVLLEYSHKYSDVDIRLTERQKSGLFIDVKAGAVDVAVFTGRGMDDGVDSVSLWSERILVTVPNFHPLAGRGYAEWADLKNEVVLVSHRGLGPEFKEILAAKTSTIGKQPKIEEHGVGGEALLSLIATGRGVTLMCEGTMRCPHPGVASLEVRDATGPTLMVYSACWRKDYANPVLTPFLELLRTHHSMLSAERRPDT